MPSHPSLRSHGLRPCISQELSLSLSISFSNSSSDVLILVCCDFDFLVVTSRSSYFSLSHLWLPFCLSLSDSHLSSLSSLIDAVASSRLPSQSRGLGPSLSQALSLSLWSVSFSISSSDVSILACCYFDLFVVLAIRA